MSPVLIFLAGWLVLAVVALIVIRALCMVAARADELIELAHHEPHHDHLEDRAA